MPGSIHVSVIDFSDLPSSSPILVKASIGKAEYQSWGKGDLSLPLTTLRDNVSITIHDAEGNELSHAGVRIISVVEKGSLNETVSLEGGGFVHLKLSFVLNEEERNKIQRMREAAAKRKRDELLRASPRYIKSDSTARETVTPSSFANTEVSDSQASVAQLEVLSTGDQVIQFGEGKEAHRKENIPNEASGSDISKGVHLCNNENHKRPEEKIETREETCSGLADKNKKEMGQTDALNTYVTKDDSLHEKIETSTENLRGFVEKNVKDMPQLDAPKIPMISTDALSLLKPDLAAPELNKTEEPRAKTPKVVRNLEKKTESKEHSLRGVHIGDKNLKKTNEKIKDSEDKQNRSEEKNEIIIPVYLPKRTINSEGNSPNSKQCVAASEVKKHVAVEEKQEPLQKTSSSVRKMISAFENSLFKERRPVIKPPPVKTAPEKVGFPEDLGSKDTKPVKLLSSDVKTSLVERLKPIETEGMKIEEQKSVLKTQVKGSQERSSDNTILTKLISSEARIPLADEQLKLTETDGMKPEEDMVTESTDSFQDASLLEEPSVLQTQVEKAKAIKKNEEDLVHMFKVEELHQDPPRSLLIPRESGCDTPDMDRPKSFNLTNSHEDNTEKTFENETETCECELSSAESSGAGIFPQEGAGVCTTTEIKHEKGSAGSYSIEERLSQRFSSSENVEKGIRNSEVYTNMNKSEYSNSSESSPGPETSCGPIRQAIKIAVMVAFGSLVLLTRKSR